MTIRAANLQDAVYLKPLLVQLGYDTLTVEEVERKITDYQKSRYMLLVCEYENMVVGFISLHCFDIFHSKGLIGRITAFCVDQGYRSQGLGKALLQAAEAYFAELGCTKIEVTSNARRLQTHAYYLNAGYREDSRRFVKYP